MRDLIWNAAVQVILTAAFSFAAAAHDIEKLAWLAGCWQSEGDNPQLTEQWMKPGGKTILGMSRTIADGKTREFEFLRIVQEENGDIYFVANPSGQKEARFRLVTVNNQEARFENPAHDFPQRIIYRREGDRLTGRIEGISAGQERAVDFPLKQFRCD